jgi:hypothetical protein
MMLPLFCHCSKHWCRSLAVRQFRSLVVFAFFSSTNTMWVPLSMDLIFGKRKKSQGAISGE